MKLRKFFGLTSRAVLDQIRTELGPDAVIVANRPTADGIEITAVAGDAMQSILEAGTTRRTDPPVAEAPRTTAPEPAPAPTVATVAPPPAAVSTGAAAGLA